jgi:hypothetical protein
MSRCCMAVVPGAVVLGLIGAAGQALAQETFVEGFENFSNEGGWTLGQAPGEVIESSGGNPGFWLHSPGLDTAIVRTGTTRGVESRFTGDYRAMGVTGLGLDAITNHVDFSAEERPMTVMLFDDNGTADDPTDDSWVYQVGKKNIPLPGEGWQSYSFETPSESKGLPDGWVAGQDFNAPPMDKDAIWETVITDVDYVVFNWHDPDFFAIFQMWDVGVDNLSITAAGGECYPDFTGEGDLDLFDFLAYVNSFNDGEDRADCTGEGVLDFFDFLCFTNAFNAGC